MGLGRRHQSAWDDAAPDEELVGWAQRGHREAFGLLYDRHLGSIYGFCYRRLGSRESAQDAAAETFRKALVGLPAYRAGSFRGWLFAIARNVIVDAIRARHPDLPLEAAAMIADTVASPEEMALAQTELASVVALLPRLTVDQGEAIAMRLAGLSPVEIGEALGKSRAAVDMTLHRALLRLRELVAPNAAPATGGEHRG